MPGRGSEAGAQILAPPSWPSGLGPTPLPAHLQAGLATPPPMGRPGGPELAHVPGTAHRTLTLHVLFHDRQHGARTAALFLTRTNQMGFSLQVFRGDGSRPCFLL